MTSDIDLIRAFANDRDETAANELFGRHYPAVYRVLLHLVNNSTDANDLTQQVFLKALKNVGQYGGRAPFRHWLMGIAVNEAKNFFRAKSREIRRDPIFETYREAAGKDSPAEDIQRREFEQQLDLALEKIPEKQRVPLVLHYFENMSYAEIAEVLAVPKSTVQTRLESAVERLRAIFKETGHAALIPLIGLYLPVSGGSAAAAGIGISPILAKIGIGTGVAVMKAKIMVAVGAVCLAIIAAVVFYFALPGGDIPEAEDTRPIAVETSDERTETPDGLATAIETPPGENGDSASGTNLEEDVGPRIPEDEVSESPVAAETDGDTPDDPIEPDETRFGTLTVAVERRDGGKVENIRILIKDMAGNELRRADIKNLMRFGLMYDQGEYSTKLPFGDYVITALSRVKSDTRHKTGFVTIDKEKVRTEIIFSRGEEKEKPSGIKGVVVDGYTGEPFPDVTMEIVGNPGTEFPETIVEIKDGEFDYELPPGSYKLRFRAEEGSNSPGYNKIIVEKGKKKRFTVRIGRKVLLTGMVTDAHTGKPLAGAKVGITAGRGSVTDLSGRYCLVLSTGYGRVVFGCSLKGYVSFHTSGGRFVDPAPPVFIGMDEEYVLDIQLVPIDSLIEGVVVDADTGKPIRDVVVNGHRDKDGNMTGRYSTDEIGCFAIPAGAGEEYRIRILHPEYHAYFADWFTVEPTSVYYLYVELVPNRPRTAIVTGRLVDSATGRFIDWIPERYSGTTISLTPERDVPHVGKQHYYDGVNAPRVILPDPAMEYRFEVEPGVYLIRIPLGGLFEHGHWQYEEWVAFSEGETVYNIVLGRCPPFIHRVYGNIIDAKTGEGIGKIGVDVFRNDQEETFWRTNSDFSRSRPGMNGSFSFQLAFTAGKFKVVFNDQDIPPLRYNVKPIRVTIKIYDMAFPNNPTEKVLENPDPLEFDIPLDLTKYQYKLTVELAPIIDKKEEPPGNGD